jgi:murein L,D-transpeptidase YafK
MLHALLVSVLSANLIAVAPALPDSGGVARAASLSTAAATSKLTGPMGLIDSIVVEKRLHQLTLFRDGKVIRTYLVALGGQPRGAKVRAGDNRTPEGVYYIDARQPFSKYHLALHISYPAIADKQRAQALGTEPGGDIMIHGLPNGMGSAGALHRQNDWTNGCIALTDQEIEEIWSVVPIGTPIEIKP